MPAQPAAPSLYTRIGGGAAIHPLVDRCCELMDERPAAYAARKIHPADLSESANKLFDLLSGALGGPQRHIEKHGHPMLRPCHLPYAIGPEERDQWLLCRWLALEETVAGGRLRRALYRQLVRSGEHMRNPGGSPQARGDEQAGGSAASLSFRSTLPGSHC
jgi:hemoglobin